MSDPRPIQLEVGIVDLVRLQLEGPRGLVELSTREVDLLRYLADRPGRIVPREELFERVWGYRETVVSRALDTAIARLRKKVERDPTQPRHLHTHYGLGYRFAPLDDRASRLPTALSSFIGRTSLLDAIAQRFASGARLVTLLGPPGVGKSRLANHFAAKRWEGAVRYVSLSDAGLSGLGARLEHALGRDGGPTLLVLDDADGVVVGLRGVLVEFLGSDDLCQALVTSRERLGVDGERVIEVAPLPSSEAVALFDDRVFARLGTTSPLPPEDVASLVEGFDRLPLAIELIANLATVESPARLLARASSVDALHQAAQASWLRLTPLEQATFAGCSVFRGGFDFDDAATVLRGATAVEDTLRALADKSLLVRRPAPQGVRLGLLATLRSFGAAELVRSGLDEAVRRRHGEHYAAKAMRLAGGVDTPAGTMRAVAQDADNLVAAALWAAEVDPALAERLLGALDAFIPGHVAAQRVAPLVDALRAKGDRGRLAQGMVAYLLGRTSEARASFEEVLGSPTDDESAVVAGARLWLVYDHLDDGRAAEVLATIHTRASVRADLTKLALVERGAHAFRHGRLDEALACLEEAVTLGAADSLLAARAFTKLGSVLAVCGQLDAAQRACERAIEAYGANGCPSRAAAPRAVLGTVLGSGRGDLVSAEACFREALSALVVGDPRGLASARTNLAMTLLEQGRVDEARIHLGESLRTARGLGRKRSLGLANGNLGIVEFVAEDTVAARRHLDAAVSVLDALGDRRSAAWFLGWRALLGAVTGDAAVAQQDLNDAVAAMGEGPVERAFVGLIEMLLCVVDGRSCVVEPAFARVLEVARIADVGGDLRLAHRVVTRALARRS